MDHAPQATVDDSKAIYRLDLALRIYCMYVRVEIGSYLF
jgi:hypothetical protein